MTLPGRCDRKIVVDTNVILFDALAINKFKSADIFIPFSVIEEIDRFKRDLGENGRNARHFSRFVDVLRDQGSLAQGVALEATKSFVYVVSDFNFTGLPSEMNLSIPDHRILATAYTLMQQNKGAVVELVTKDINLRIKADVFGIDARDYDPENTHLEDMYKGVKEIDLNPEQIDKFYRDRGLEITADDGEFKFFANQYLIMKDKANPNHSAIGRYDGKQNRVVPLISPTESVWGIHPRNMEQSFAFDALLNDELLFVSLVGKAGTGKTLLALAAGLHKTLDEGRFQRLLVSRPIFPMGRDIGYLPGDVEQKLNPWMQPIFDNVEFLLGADKKAAGRAQELINQGMLNIEPLTYIRGRSIPSQYLIVDESQNLTPHEIKTIVTRAGQGTKVVLTGDCYQIDNPYIDSSNSGLTYSVERFKGQKISAHVSLSKGERSELAELAANIL
ncbi:MAG: PhoH family protein [Bdellovibrionales bacterium]|nr:PhoH family protein [Bdellovibrionales bacterium]